MASSRDRLGVRMVERCRGTEGESWMSRGGKERAVGGMKKGSIKNLGKGRGKGSEVPKG